MKKYKSLFWFIVLIIFLLTFYTSIKKINNFNNEDAYKVNKEFCQQGIQDEYSGIIDSTFYEKGIYTYIVNSREYDFWAFLNINCHKPIVHKGDSIVKKKGESQFYIYPKNNFDTVIILKFDCNMWDKMDSINNSSGY